MNTSKGDSILLTNIYFHEFFMNNKNAHKLLIDCWSDILDIKKEINLLPPMDKKISYLTSFCLIRCCGTIELCSKTILFDFACRTTCPKTQSFIENKILKSPNNPRINRLIQQLNYFDRSWGNLFSKNFKNHPKKLKLESSLDSLAELRNKFAHGESYVAAFNDIRNYYVDAWKIITLYDAVVI